MGNGILVMTRRPGEQIVLRNKVTGRLLAEITVDPMDRGDGRKAILAIRADEDVMVYRRELDERIREGRTDAGDGASIRAGHSPGL